MENRRQFTRILFNLPANLELSGKTLPVNLTDISLNGALIRTTAKDKLITIEPNTKGTLHIELTTDQNIIEMLVELVHFRNDEIGLKCQHIDIESISHLKRLVELNLGDDEQLNKELSQLSSN